MVNHCDVIRANMSSLRIPYRKYNILMYFLSHPAMTKCLSFSTCKLCLFWKINFFSYQSETLVYFYRTNQMGTLFVHSDQLINVVLHPRNK